MATPLVIEVEVTGNTYNVIARAKKGADLIFIPMIRVVEEIGGNENHHIFWPNTQLQAPHSGTVIHSGRHQGGKLTVVASHIAYPRLITKAVATSKPVRAARKPATLRKAAAGKPRRAAKS